MVRWQQGLMTIVQVSEVILGMRFTSYELNLGDRMLYEADTPGECRAYLHAMQNVSW